MKINEHDSLKQLLILKELCNKIYIARNISLSNDDVIRQLELIDNLFKDSDGQGNWKIQQLELALDGTAMFSNLTIWVGYYNAVNQS